MARRKKQPLHESQWRGAVLGPSGADSRGNLPPARLGFLGPLPKSGEAKSGGVGSVTVVPVSGRHGVEDATVLEDGVQEEIPVSKGSKQEDMARLVAHGLVSTYTLVSLGSCGSWIGVFTYIESLPTYNYRLPILPSWLLGCLLDEPRCQIHGARVMPAGSA